jgi:hypothetical protein
MKTGCDLSHHQASFDAGRYFASGESFVILKATEGGSFTDPAFTGRWRAAAGHPRAAYHFARPGSGPVDAQADHFVAVVRVAGWRAGDAWALDLEDSGGLGPATLLTWADRWCARVRAALGGRGLFYSGVAFVLEALGDPGRIPGGCLGWIARYRSDTPWAAPWRRPAGWPEIPAFWQCTNGEAGCVHDVVSVGRCDWNKATDAAFAALFAREEADVPLTEAEWERLEGLIDRRADETDVRLKAKVDQVAGLLFRGDPGTPDGGTHADHLKSVHADTQALLEKVAAIAPTLTDAQAELIGGRILAALQVGRLVGSVAVELGPE